MERLERYNGNSDTYLACDDTAEGLFGQVISILDADGDEMHYTVHLLEWRKSYATFRGVCFG